MGYQILKQPDDRFAIFSTYTDTIIIWDATKDETVDWFVAAAAERAREDALRVLEHVAAGEPRRAYFQFVMTWEEALEADRDNDGEAWRETQRT